jgi:hypothetical protein
MRILNRLLVAATALVAVPAATAAEGVTISQERQSYLEGVWSGVPATVSADKLCSKETPPPDALALSIEFLRSGGTAFSDAGADGAVRGAITAASEDDGVVTLTFGSEVWRLRPEGDKIMYRVRSSASLSGDADSIVFKRCQKAADRSAIALDDGSLKLLAADLPGDEAFFMDERLAAKDGDRCAVDATQYLFFVLIGPSEFRLSRWNSFALADKLASNPKAKEPSVDPVANWRIERARKEGKKYVFRMRDYDKKDAPPETIHVEAKGASIVIPEWKRTYVRCKGFQSRS